MMLRLLFISLLLFSGGVHAASITIAAPFNRPPYILEDSRSGLELDIIREAMESENLMVDFKFYSRKRQILFFNKERVDAVMTANASLGLEGYWSDEYIQYSNVALSLASNSLQINQLADMRGYSVASFEGAQLVLGPEFRSAIANTIYREVSPQDGLNKMLYMNRIDVVIADKYIFLNLNKFLSDNIDTQQPLTEHQVLPPTGYRVIFRNSVARDKFNLGLAKIRKNGTYEALIKQYLSTPAL